MQDQKTVLTDELVANIMLLFAFEVIFESGPCFSVHISISLMFDSTQLLSTRIDKTSAG